VTLLVMQGEGEWVRDIVIVSLLLCDGDPEVHTVSVVDEVPEWEREGLPVRDRVSVERMEPTVTMGLGVGKKEDAAGVRELVSLPETLARAVVGPGERVAVLLKVRVAIFVVGRGERLKVFILVVGAGHREGVRDKVRVARFVVGRGERLKVLTAHREEVLDLVLVGDRVRDTENVRVGVELKQLVALLLEGDEVEVGVERRRAPGTNERRRNNKKNALIATMEENMCQELV
jgi:hypothetical protein